MISKGKSRSPLFRRSFGCRFIIFIGKYFPPKVKITSAVRSEAAGFYSGGERRGASVIGADQNLYLIREVGIF